MESNRDEADRCIDIAILALREAKLDKAEKFLNKAENLFPSQRAKDLLKKVLASSREKMAEEPISSAKSAKRKASPARAKEQVEPEYTKEQLELVKKIKKCKDFYEVLGIAKDAPDSEIRKAYKRLALQLHPDKNKAPGADESFKAIGNAVATLTDDKKRKMYDLYGKDEFNTGGSGGGMRQRQGNANEFGFNRGFEADVTAEELFNIFFGGGFPQQQNVFTRTRRFHRAEAQRQTNNREQQQSSYSALINLLPIILLITLSMMSSLFISEPIYSMQPSPKYSIHRETNTFKVSYYVKDNFHTEYQGSLGRLEASVEEEHINNLKHLCYRERNYKESMLQRARNFGDRDLHRRAQIITTPACESLQKMQNQ